jgi:UDP-GlcNAc:undecaprenyl-phosphate GlcNAc-1-phosphate transferase
VIIFAFLTATFISMAIIPVMISLAPRLGMIDQPDPRKVHTRAVARIGGVGIAIGSLVSICLWVRIDNTVAAYLFGSVVLLLFGAWDDRRELSPYVKFIGQFIAVVAIVYWGDVWISSFPFVASALPEQIGKPFTVFAIVGMINAINHSDGLDGLAGGESLMSLGCIAYLAYLADGYAVMSMTVAIIGGVFGFLHFNTYPARIFMGDSGSQFLGFSLGVLAVLLTQKVNQNLSMALPALILGLPVIDILAVLAQRVYHEQNWFRATKNHIHHRLLELGYDHYQAVLIIYSIQAFFVCSALLLRYESDLLVLSLYIGVCALVFASLIIAERSGWKANKHGMESGVASIIRSLQARKLVVEGPILFVAVSIPLYFVLGSLWVQHVSADFGVAAMAIAAALLLGLAWQRLPLSRYLVRLASYGIAAFLVYLIGESTAQVNPVFRTLEIAYFVVLAIAFALAVRYGRDIDFRTTPTDYLIILLVAVTGFLWQGTLQEDRFGLLLLKVVILFYGSELIINTREKRWNGLLDFSVITASGILGLKGILLF